MERTKPESFLDRTLVRVHRAWRNIVSTTPALGDGGTFAPDLPDHQLPALDARLHDCLYGAGGDYAARARTAELGRTYLRLSATGRSKFLTVLAESLQPDPETVAQEIEHWRRADDSTDRLSVEASLRDALTAPRVRLLKQFNALPEGVKFLVDMREDLLACKNETAHLAALDDDLKDLLVSWFDLGFLQFQQITWESPAALLEKLIAYEAVHEIRSWRDLRNRLESDRRCFALFHPSMSAEPLAFVEVALTKGLAGRVQDLLDIGAPTADPDQTDTAIFYSISNTQKGLRGVSFGEHLIKKVVESLSLQLPQIQHFATLSPVPGFRRWVDEQIEAEALALSDQDSMALERLRSADWTEDPAPDAPMQDLVHRLAAAYFSQRRGDGQPIDAVARFHLRNGARLERLNWPGDSSDSGVKQAYGLMVNYRYDLKHLEANHEAYVQYGTVAAARTIRDLMKRVQKDGQQ